MILSWESVPSSHAPVSSSTKRRELGHEHTASFQLRRISCWVKRVWDSASKNFNVRARLEKACEVYARITAQMREETQVVEAV